MESYGCTYMAHYAPTTVQLAVLRYRLLGLLIVLWRNCGKYRRACATRRIGHSDGRSVGNRGGDSMFY